jgi:ELWxxDGT repeat protein
MVEFNGRFYFSASTKMDRSLWVYNGEGSPSVATTALSNPRNIVKYDNRLFFAAYDLSSDNELWSFDGSNAAIAASINPGDGSNPSYLTEYSGRLYFTANDGTNGQELWVYDADLDSAWMVTDIRSGGNPAAPGNLTTYNGVLYFSATDDTRGNEFWAYDADLDSAYLVTDIYAGGSSNPNGFRVFDGKLYFSANDGSSQTLWSYNGVDAPVKVAGAGTVNLNTHSDTSMFNGELYFRSYSTLYGYEPWQYDGITAPSMVADINSGGDSYAWQFYVY